MEANLMNGLSLAYIGDAIYELKIREKVIATGLTKVDSLHKQVIKFTSGEAQAYAIHYYLDNNLLSEEEISIFKRGRNAHVNSKRKNLSLDDYLEATGFESLMGYLYLKHSDLRLSELIEVAYDSLLKR